MPHHNFNPAETNRNHQHYQPKPPTPTMPVIQPNFPIALIDNTHTSEETALQVDNYFLNGKYIQARYWIETQNHSQRVMRQVYMPNHSLVRGWSKPKAMCLFHHTVVVMAHFQDLTSIDPHLLNAKINATEPIIFAPINLYELPQDFPKDDPVAVGQVKSYFKLNPEQCAIVDNYFHPQFVQAAKDHQQHKTRQQANNPELEAIRVERERLKLELEQIRAERERIDLELRRQRLQKVESRQTQQANRTLGKRDKILAKIRATPIGDSLTREQVELLFDLAWDDPSLLPGNIKPYMLLKETAGGLTFHVHQQRVDPAMERFPRWYEDEPSFSPEQNKERHDRLWADAVNSDAEIKQKNDEFYITDKERREKGEPAPYRSIT